MVCLRSMQHAVYSLFIVESVIPGVGVTVRDLLSRGTILIADLGFGKTAQPGLVFASRLLFHESFAMTGGAVLPVGVLPQDRQQAITKKLAGTVKADDDGYFDPAPMIRECLKEGCSLHIQYREPAGRLVGQERAPERIHSSKASRNAPCPCGSGKKFKNCCGRVP